MATYLIIERFGFLAKIQNFAEILLPHVCAFQSLWHREELNDQYNSYF